MTDTVERVASAICRALELDPDEMTGEFVPEFVSRVGTVPKWVDAHHPRWHDFRGEAQREIIAAAARRELLAIDVERREAKG